MNGRLLCEVGSNGKIGLAGTVAIPCDQQISFDSLRGTSANLRNSPDEASVTSQYHEGEEIDMDCSDLLQSSLHRPGETESAGAKLQREAQLLMGGFAGFGEAAQRSISSEHILETTGKLALGIAIGLGIAYLSRGGSIARTGVRIFGAATTISFANDVLLHGNAVKESVTDTWRSDINWERNLSVMKGTVGQFAFDTALMTAAGLAGGALQLKLAARIQTKPRVTEAPAVEHPAARDPAYPLGFKPDDHAYEIIPTMRTGHTGAGIDMYGADTVVGQLHSRYGKSIVPVEVNLGSGPALRGTGFFVGKDGTVATCFHVVETSGSAGAKCTVTLEGKTFTARIKSLDLPNDLALLKVEGIPPEAIQPLPVAPTTRNLAAQTETVTLGYGGSNTLIASPGLVDKAVFKFPKVPPDLAATPDATYVSLSAHTHSGASGAPVFSSITGEVIGVHSAGNQRNLAFARPSEFLLDLMTKPANVLRPGTK